MSLEKHYFESIKKSHAKTFSQYYTSQPIAGLMVKWLLKSNPSKLYDPCFGMGSFYQSAINNDFTGEYHASEIDKVSYDFYQKHGNKTNLTLINQDYFDSKQSCEAIIANPPYFKFQKFPNKDIVLEKLGEYFGVKLSGYTNSASAFLLKSVHELKAGGRLAYIIPMEFLSANYGEAVKRILIQQGSIHQIIYIKDEAGVFDGVTTTVCIIFFEKKHLDNHEIVFSRIENASDLKIDVINRIKQSIINPTGKWLGYFDEKTESELPASFIPLHHYGKFKRGIATGANEFFVLSPAQVKDMGLARCEYDLCLTKANQVNSSLFDYQSVERLIRENKPVYLFNPKVEVNSLSLPAQQYIKQGEAKDYHKRYLTKNRKQWYILEKRPVFPILFGVFSRGHCKIIRNYTDILSLTTFHGLEAKDNFSDYVDRLFVFMHTTLGKQSLLQNRRKYGGDLDKFEPSDLNTIKVPAPEQFDLISDDLLTTALVNLRQLDCLSDETNNQIVQLLQ